MLVQRAETDEAVAIYSEESLDEALNIDESKSNINENLKNLKRKRINLNVSEKASFVPLTVQRAVQDDEISQKGTNYTMVPQISAPIVYSDDYFRIVSGHDVIGQGLQFSCKKGGEIYARDNLSLTGVNEKYVLPEHKDKRKFGLGTKRSNATLNAHVGSSIKSDGFVSLEAGKKLDLHGVEIEVGSGKIKAEEINCQNEEGINTSRTHRSGFDHGFPSNGGSNRTWNTIYKTTITAKGDFYVESAGSLTKCGLELHIGGRYLEDATLVISRTPEEYDKITVDKDIACRLIKVAVIAAVGVVTGGAVAALMSKVECGVTVGLASSAAAGAAQAALNGEKWMGILKSAMFGAVSSALANELRILIPIGRDSLTPAEIDAIRGTLSNALVKGALDAGFSDQGLKDIALSILTSALSEYNGSFVKDSFLNILTKEITRAGASTALGKGKFFENLAEGMAGVLGNYVGERLSNEIKDYLNPEPEVEFIYLTEEELKELEEFANIEDNEAEMLENMEPELLSEQLIPEDYDPAEDSGATDADKSSTSIRNKFFDQLKELTGVLFNDADAAEIDFSDYEYNESKASNADSQDTEIGFLQKMYNKVDFFLKEAHRMNYIAEQNLERIYEEYPELRINDSEYRAGFKRFRSMVPENANELAFDLALNIIFGMANKAAGPLVNKTRNILNQYNKECKINRSLGANPFKKKDFKKIDKILRKQGFATKGQDPFSGVGSYFHPKTGRKYYLDRAVSEKAKKGNQRETPHVDVHRKFEGKNIENTHEIPKDVNIKEPKRKYPLGENLYVPK